jgi:hypothetical protein
MYVEESEISIASDLMRGRYGNLFFSLTKLGYCLNPCDVMRELIKDYVAIYSDQQPCKSKLNQLVL